MSIVRPGDSKTIQFVTHAASGADADALSTPTGVLILNGTDTAVTVTITDIGVGLYTAAWTIPSSYEGGDEVQIRVTATDSNNDSGSAIIWSATLTAAQGGTSSTIPDLPDLPTGDDLLISDDEVFKRTDWTLLANFCSDTEGEITTKAQLAAHANYFGLKHTACADVRSALLASGRYTTATLYTISEIDFGLIYQLVCDLMVMYAYRRKPDRRPQDYPQYYQQLMWRLHRLKYGDDLLS